MPLWFGPGEDRVRGMFQYMVRWAGESPARYAEMCVKADDRGRLRPVPVYYPDVTEILGTPVFRRLADIGRPIDMVNVFRRSHDIPPHVDDILAVQPKSVWFQLGIRNDEAAETLARAGIKVVQDRCLMVEWRRHRK
jgi:predicted CoA-binding protein